MGRFEELCFLCGICTTPPTELTPDPPETTDTLVKALLDYDPDIINQLGDDIGTEEDLHEYLLDIIEDLTPADLEECGEAFSTCIAIGYFNHDGNAPHEDVDDPTIKRKIPDGHFVSTRLVKYGSCGEFEVEIIRRKNNTGEITEVEEERMSRTCAYWQNGFGNFYMLEPCYLFLETWLDYTRLPPMWNNRQLSFSGELYEILNSRESGRVDGWLEWLNPGGTELTLDQTQDFLRTESIVPKATAKGLKRGLSRKLVMECIYDDYGYWKFATPHRWPHCTEPKELASLMDLGFDIPARSSPSSSDRRDSLTRFSTEILVQIFGWLPDFATYRNLMAVSKTLHDLISGAKFSTMVLREMLRPSPARALFWVYPMKTVPGEVENFVAATKTWMIDPPGLVQPETVLFFPHFPLVHFLHAMFTEGSPRNRRRLWRNIKRLEDVWADYRRNGWKVNRFGVHYPQ